MATFSVAGGSFLVLVISCLMITALAENTDVTTEENPVEITTEKSPCLQNPCENDTVCHLDPHSEDGSIQYLCLAEGRRPGSCSIHAFLSCDQYATCEDSADLTSFTCHCQDGSKGDGFQTQVNGTGCRFAFKPCSGNTDCPEFGYCDKQSYKCACKAGFQGDGFNCTDVDECLKSPCDPHAMCQNTPGNFTCTCNGLNNWIGDGLTCHFFCYNDNDCDVPRAKCDDSNKCQCNQGYVGNGLNCTDFDECAKESTNNCSSNSDCINKVGGYKCQCKNGYTGDGYTCIDLPERCDNILDFKPGSTYIIDPDFTGPANAFEVICDRISDVVVTRVPPTDIFPLATPDDDASLVIHYKPTPFDLVAFTEGAGFCSQNISFSCYVKFSMFPGTIWQDARGQSHENWGSTKYQKCACGEVGLCPSACFCDGNQTQTLTTDSGQIIDKNNLPLVSITFKQDLKDKGRLTNVGPLECAQKQFNIPKDCDEIKFKRGVQKNTASYVNLGQLDTFQPILVSCLMESYSHVGITSLPPIIGTLVPTSKKEVDISYSIDISFVQILVNTLKYCSQSVEFTCKNSKLLNNEGYVSVTSSKRRLGYFPGANGKADTCGCGSTQSCDDLSVQCNCNIEDGQERKDFGVIINKTDLPLVAVSAVVGDNSSGSYVIGQIKCAARQFGIEPNCEKYRATGIKRNGTYIIDPDGPGGQKPFAVTCVFLNNPPQGLTIIHHSKETQQALTDKTLNITYLQVSGTQIAALKNRSTVCTQAISVGCESVNIYNGPAGITWTDGNGSRSPLTDYLDTCGKDGLKCNCNKGDGRSSDSGTITDMTRLPVRSLDISKLMDQLAKKGQLTITLGPLVCSEVFPTCAALKSFLSSGKAVQGEAAVVNGRFTIDPDGAGGEEGFEVTCNFPATIISIESPVGGLSPFPDKPGPISTCFDIKYKNENGQTITAAQVTALVQKSGKCRQDLTLECQNAPATNKVNYTSCDGQPQKGWAGSFGEDKCACGVNGNCDGGPLTSCNCDVADNKVRSDGGSLINKTSMPVCQICFSIDPIVPAGGGTGPTSVLRYKLGELKCDTDQGTKTNCQDARQSAGTTIKSIQESAVPVNAGTNLPIGCRFFPDPPIGILLVKASKPINPPSIGNHTDIKIVYITISITLVRSTFKDNEFCSQNIFIFNASSENLKISGDYGFYTHDGRISTEWTALNESNKYVQKACSDNADLCSKYGKPKGFSLTSKDDLPLTRVMLPGAGVIVVIGDVECLDLKKSCQHILDSKVLTTGLIGGKRFAIDPDQAGDIQPFTVNCDFDRTNENGVSEILPSGQWVTEVKVTGQKLPGNYSLNVQYNGVSIEQIVSLTKVSAFCWQWVTFTCRSTPLVTRTSPTKSSYYNLYGLESSPSFGTDFDVTTPGCACAKTGTCVSPSYSCNCDALGSLAIDQGAVTNKQYLPITQVVVGGQPTSAANARVKLSGVRCSSLPIDPPRDCADALKIGNQFGVSYSYSGEFLISPNPAKVKPFMVRCEFDLVTGVGITLIKVVSEKITLQPPGIPTYIPYHAPSLEQLLALISFSKYCYQAVKYDCVSSTIFSEGGYWLSAGSNVTRTFWGGGQPGSNGLGGPCACGQEKNCGGLDSANGQRTRFCNCDYGDNRSRSDAGIISVKEYLPVASFVVGKNARFLQASLIVGDVFCSQDPLEFDECDMNMHDCHPRATCVDQPVGYTCVCPPGWNGKGVVTNSNMARANGRECIDDDECVAAKPCPYSATCVNTPGDFTCECHPGYKKTGKTSCEDINECANSTLNNCDKNARCDNLGGSYRCVCNRGYRGDGQTCLPVGDCVCFGDPHCITYDNRWLHLQRPCDYVMSQDGCRDDQEQTFRIEIETWKKDSGRPVSFSYVKSVKILIFGKKIILEQGGRISIDGSLVRQYYDGHLFGVSVINNITQLWTVSDLQVMWDGQDVVQVTVPKNAKDSVCGLCGNYNGDPVDDNIQGPTCSLTEGEQTNNTELFVQSWITESSSCEANCRINQPPSPDSQCIFPKPLVEKECNKLFDIKTSPFKDCLKQKDTVELGQLHYSCIYDLCHVDGDLEEHICRFAEIMAWDCQENEKISVNGWRLNVEACEVTKCPNNMIYKACGNSSQPTCLTSDQKQHSLTFAAACIEGCFCEDGLVMESDRCIEPEQCGCSYHNGYLAVGDKVLLQDCSAEIRCIEQNTTKEFPIGCKENEVCQTKDGVLGCYCQEGYRMDNQGKCAPDACYKVECKFPNMVCIDGECACKDGYTGDCSHCVDINECETNLADCHWIGQTCLNTNGSYLCICEEGYAANGKFCKDIDECEYEIDNCGANSKCVNTPGGFVCECCQGYKKSDSGSCVRDPSGGSAGAKCCACHEKDCNDPGKVCGTDGKTYSSFRSLYMTACKTNNDNLKFGYPGPCKVTCETVVCDKQYSTCEMKNDIPTCLCPTCEDTSTSYIDTTVCGTDNVTYISKCHLEAATCRSHLEVKVEVQYTGRPCPGKGPPLSGPWSDWSDCSEKCKQGVRTRTRDVYVNSSDVSLHSVETIICYSTCDEGPCHQDTCTEPGQVCVADDNNDTSCVCPVCDNLPEDLICGRLGIVIHTYSTECELNRRACEEKEASFEVLEPRACEEKPVNCSLIRKYDVVVDENGCEADRSINFGDCYGGCDKEAELCCFGTGVEERDAIMYCPNGSNFQKRFEVITDCSCVTKEQALSHKTRTLE